MVKIEKKNVWTAIKNWLAQLNDSHERFGSKQWFKAYGFVVLGTLLFVIADTMFNNPYHLAPGGTYGLKNVLNTLFPWELSYYLICLDLPLMIIGLVILGPRFGIKTLLSVVLGYLFVWIIENTWGYAPVIHVGDWSQTAVAGAIEVAKSPRWDWVTFVPNHMGEYFVPDYMLNTIVSGLLYGLGIGLIFKAGATSGGSDIISMIINKYTHLSLGTLVIIVDSCIALSSLLIGGDIRLPIYSVILIYIEGKVIDMIVDTKVNRTLMIVTNNVEEVKTMIVTKLERSGTVFTGKGLYKGEERDMIYTAVTRKEYVTIKYNMKKIDPKAFISVISNTEVLGEGFDKLPTKGEVDL